MTHLNLVLRSQSLTRREGHESPPEAVQEGPLESGRVLLSEEDKAGEGQDGDAH